MLALALGAGFGFGFGFHVCLVQKVKSPQAGKAAEEISEPPIAIDGG